MRKLLIFLCLILLFGCSSPKTKREYKQDWYWYHPSKTQEEIKKVKIECVDHATEKVPNFPSNMTSNDMIRFTIFLNNCMELRGYTKKKK